MGFGPPDGSLGGLIAVLLLTLVAAATVGGVLYQHHFAVIFRRLADRVAPPPELPANPPIEQVARDARRVRAQLLALAPGTPMTKRRGLWQAYDDLLAVACRVLDVPDTLTGLDPGLDRDAERLHVEDELHSAGLRLSA
jgi:hypothetical protein